MYERTHACMYAHVCMHVHACVRACMFLMTSSTICPYPHPYVQDLENTSCTKQSKLHKSCNSQVANNLFSHAYVISFLKKILQKLCRWNSIIYMGEQDCTLCGSKACIIWGSKTALCGSKACIIWGNKTALYVVGSKA